MRLKDRNSSPEGGFVFYYESPTSGEPVAIPPKGSANGLDQLGSIVRATFENNGIEIPGDLALAIEHQICLRQEDPLSRCFSGGIGDDVHHKVMKPLLKTLAKAAKSVGAGKTADNLEKVGGCSGCGGTKVYQVSKNNLGRAGSLNKFAGNADYKYR